ncbi:MAG: aldehyde dehydrogenase family protein, partial [Bdellovibrionales bacterium]|nr:aldehyde dehydrogenase family protein [Oligoflexia bacterium]
INAVIDERSFKKIGTYIDWARGDSSMKVLAGGESNGKTGYFVRPTLLQALDPKARTMCEEIFGPVLSLYVYDDSKLEETLQIANDTSPYALTGAIITQDRHAMLKMMEALKHASGNFYINDKPTGAVVGQQPFGGARRSGTNDKAGSAMNLLRFMSVRTIKENFVPPKQVLYPYMDEA